MSHTDTKERTGRYALNFHPHVAARCRTGTKFLQFVSKIWTLPLDDGSEVPPIWQGLPPSEMSLSLDSKIGRCRRERYLIMGQPRVDVPIGRFARSAHPLSSVIVRYGCSSYLPSAVLMAPICLVSACNYINSNSSAMAERHGRVPVSTQPSLFEFDAKLPGSGGCQSSHV